MKEPCPKCGRSHTIGEYETRPDKAEAPRDIRCECGLTLRWSVPIIKTTASGYVLRLLRDDEVAFVNENQTLQPVMSIAAFISAGMRGDVKKLDQARNDAGTGCLELVNAGISYALYLGALADAGCAVTGGFPGVFEYEVAEAFGALYVNETVAKASDEAYSTPDHAKMCTAALDMTFQFFAGLGRLTTDDMRAKLLVALKAVPLPSAPEI